MLEPTRARRLCEEGRNELKGRNELMSLFPERLREDFGEIIHDHEALETTYVYNRYDNTDASFMDKDFHSRSPANKVSRWSESDKNWQVVETVTAEQLLRKVVDDRAELSFASELYMISRHVSVATGDGHLPLMNTQPSKRVLFIQGGIGVGKTTMLHHFKCFVAPKLNNYPETQVGLYPIIIDFNYLSSVDSIVKVWNKVKHKIREQLSNLTELDNIKGWELISEQEMKDSDGNYIPRIATSVTPEKEMLQMIHDSKKDNIFIKRVAQYLGDKVRPSVLVVILDNIDPLALKRQMAYIKQLMSFLDEIQHAIGVITVREYTLGKLSHQEDFRAYMYLPSIRMTSPKIGEMVQKRFNKYIKKMDNFLDGAHIRLDLNENTEVTTYDIRNMFLHVKSAFGSYDAPHRRKLRWYLSDFLNYVTNSNARHSLNFVLMAMESWALYLSGVVTEYLWQRDRNKKIRLPEFTVDELVRLAAVGQYEYYDHTDNGLIYNVFAKGHSYPKASSGRIPLLFTYRVIQYFHSVGRKASLNRAMKLFGCFGYTKAEVKETFQDLIDAGFLESRESNKIDGIQFLYATRKLHFYFHTFSKMLIYLENIRNDSVIEYEAKPHKVRTDIYDDVKEVLKFIWYIMEQEEEEYSFMKQKPKSRMPRYKEIVTGEPVSWRLLRSVKKRYSNLYQEYQYLFTEEEGKKIMECEAELKAEIEKRCKIDLIWPFITEAFDY